MDKVIKICIIFFFLLIISNFLFPQTQNHEISNGILDLSGLNLTTFIFFPVVSILNLSDLLSGLHTTTLPSLLIPARYLLLEDISIEEIDIDPSETLVLVLAARSHLRTFPSREAE